MNPASPTSQAHLGELLDRREAELRQAIAADASATAREHDRTEVTDRKDAAGDEAQALLDDAVASHAAQELDDIAAARRRLAEGTYGRCVGCGEAIDERRLLALPAAALCTACQASRETAAH